MPLLIFHRAIVLVLVWTTTAVAEPRLERAAFQLSDACTAEHDQLLSVLSAVTGVRSIDLTLVPGHMLVDVDRELLSARDLAPIVRRLTSERPCLVEPMESCISTTTLSHPTDASQPGEAEARSH